MLAFRHWRTKFNCSRVNDGGKKFRQKKSINKEARMEYVHIVIVVAIIQYMVLGALVGRARGKYGVSAPAITGAAEFDRTFRVHQNTLEGLVIFVPGLWIFGTYVNPSVAAGLGVIGIIGRILFAMGYLSAAEKRGPGAATCGLVNAVLMVGSLIGLIRNVI
jgi:glutathione S-transferase